MGYLILDKINFSYDKTKIITDFNLVLEKGEIVLIKGPSGIGKTSLLKIISGLENVDSGEIILNGDNITKLNPEKRKIGFLFQNFALFPHMNVFKNIEYGISHLKDKNEKIDKLLSLVKLEHLKNKYPHEISGGEKQRVALIRSLATEPKLLLLDEPFSSLDNNLKSSLRIELKKILNNLNITTIIVSHDDNDSIIADKIIEL